MISQFPILRNWRMLLWLMLCIVGQGCEEESPTAPDPCAELPVLEQTAQILPQKGRADGAVELRVANAQTGESYQFSRNDTLYQRIGRFSGLRGGRYTFYVKNQTGCKGTLEVNLGEQPSISLLSPQQNDTVALPVRVFFSLFNWPLQGGQQLAYRLNSAPPVVFAAPSPLALPLETEGWHTVKMELVGANNVPTGWADSVRFYAIDSSYVLTVQGGTGSGEYLIGQRVELAAGTPPTGQRFRAWRGYTLTLSDTLSSNTHLFMPRQDVTVAAFFEPIRYLLTVASGTGGGQYAAGTTVSVTANAPATGKVFDRWTGDAALLAQPAQPATTLTMPARPATITATYKDAPLGEPISYARQIAPLLNLHCNFSGCHNTGSNYGNLTTYPDVKAKTEEIKEFVTTGRMPPSGGMTPAEIQTLVDWINQGALNN